MFNISFPLSVHDHYRLWSEGVICRRKGVIRRRRQREELICGSLHRLHLELFFFSVVFSQHICPWKKCLTLPVCVFLYVCVLKPPGWWEIHRGISGHTGRKKTEEQITVCSIRQESKSPWREGRLFTLNVNTTRCKVWISRTREITAAALVETLRGQFDWNLLKILN